MARLVRKEQFTQTETRAVKLPVAEGALGKLAVYARKTGGAGTATVAVYGSFTSDISDSNLRIQVTTATGTGAGALTLIQAATDFPFPYVHLVVTNTGAASNDIYLVTL